MSLSLQNAVLYASNWPPRFEPNEVLNFPEKTILDTFEKEKARRTFLRTFCCPWFLTPLVSYEQVLLNLLKNFIKLLQEKYS